ncbi:MAG: SAM-dependent methyltransferase [Verrucomicrobia bacterium]|nr:SAM-dependent methyltransferase [Verrucomicrobiota bacterium]
MLAENSPGPERRGVSGDKTQRWIDALREAIDARSLVRIILSDPGPDSSVRRLRIRPVEIRGEHRLQVVSETATQATTQNLPPAPGIDSVAQQLGNPFRSALLTTTSRSLQLQLRPDGSARLRAEECSTPVPDLGHDRFKVRRIETSKAWLRLLGVTTPGGAVCKGMEAKFRQIHRFVELLEPLLGAAGLMAEGAEPSPLPLRFVDVGCGKGYLTFAAHEALQGQAGRTVFSRGIERREDLVRRVNATVSEAGVEGLIFEAGSIEAMDPGPIDILMALHACDTATDEALALGVRTGAHLVMVAPCCHRELRPQLVAPDALRGALSHGIFLERQSEFVTDALRAALMEQAGYETRVFEFISPEHTAKNLMIACIRRGDADPGKLPAVRALAGLYGVHQQRLADRLGVPLVG